MASPTSPVTSLTQEFSPEEAKAPSEARVRVLEARFWRYHPPTGFWWLVRLGRKWRCHETVLALLPDGDFRFIVERPELAQGASVPA